MSNRFGKFFVEVLQSLGWRKRGKISLQPIEQLSNSVLQLCVLLGKPGNKHLFLMRFDRT